MSPLTNSPLPKFERPPVIETVLGVQFEPIEGFSNAHLGAYWNTLGSDWNDVTDAPWIRPQFEKFDDSPSIWAMPTLHLSRNESTRIMLKHNGKNKLIQIQNGRFHFNWLGHGGDGYPSFESLLPQFQSNFGNFEEYVTEKIGALKINQWEITYVNMIEKGELWAQPSDLGNVLNIFALEVKESEADIAKFEAIKSELRYEIPEKAGRLHVLLESGRLKDDKEYIHAKLTARGPINDTMNLENGLKKGREAIVRMFKALTSDGAHKFWREITDAK